MCVHVYVLLYINMDISGKGQAVGDPYMGISAASFPEDINKILLAPLDPKDVEIKPDGMN